MYEELVKRLRKTSCGAKDTSWWQAADAIEELQKAVLRLEEESGILDELPMYQQPVGWIPVTERLPESDANVLVCYEWTGQSGTVYREVGIASIEELKRDPTELFRPLHWMPLPEPPKEE